MELEEFYNKALNTRPFDLSTNPIGFPAYTQGAADMSAHLPVLRYFASQCNHITEFGLREGFSTAALALGLDEMRMRYNSLVSYDIIRHPVHDIFNKMVFPCKWDFILKDIVSPGWSIKETDFLFVDDLHTYNQVKAELSQHGHMVKRFLGFHDTYSQGEQSLDCPGEEGILRAINEYTKDKWQLVYEVKFNHGLRIYKRVSI